MMAPRCIHSPLLAAGHPSPILWETVDGARSYVLERRLNPLPGRIPVEYFDYTWRRIHQDGRAFGELRKKRPTWKQLRRLGGKVPVPGYDTFTPVATGAVEPAEDNHVGLPWRGIHSRAATCGEIADDGLSWRGIAALGTPVSHVRNADTVPMEAESAVYRVMAVGEGVESPWQYSAPIKLLHHAAKDDTLPVQAGCGGSIRAAVAAQDVRFFPPDFAISYNPDALELRQLRNLRAETLSRQEGVITLRDTVDAEGRLFSGALSLLTLETKQDVETNIRLS